MRREISAIFVGDLSDQHAQYPNQRQRQPPQGQHNHSLADILQQRIDPVPDFRHVGTNIPNQAAINQNPKDRRYAEALYGPANKVGLLEVAIVLAEWLPII